MKKAGLRYFTATCLILISLLFLSCQSQTNDVTDLKSFDNQAKELFRWHILNHPEVNSYTDIESILIDANLICLTR